MRRLRRTRPLRWLLMPVEAKHRELDAKLWLACCAAGRGYGAIVGNGRVMRRDLRRANPSLPRGLCLEKSMAPGKHGELRHLRETGYRVCVSDEESLLAYKQPERFLGTRLDADTLAMTDGFFAWGERQAELMREAHPEHAGRIRTTGTPRADLWATGLRELYRPAVDAIHRRLGRYILLPSNFCSLLHVFGPDHRLEQARRHGNVQSDADERFHREQNDHLRRVLPEFVRALEAMRERYPDHALVVRPHQADDPQQWRLLTNHIDGCHVLHEDTATPWLLGADAIFHNGCTTAVEAHLLGKLPISYHPYWDERFEAYLQTRVGPRVTDRDELLAWTDDVIAGRAVSPVDREWLDRHIRVDPERTAAEHIVDALDELDWPAERFREPILHPRHLRRTAGYRLGRTLRGVTAVAPKAGGALHQQKWPPTPPSEIAERVAFFADRTGRPDGVTASRLGAGGIYAVLPAT